MDGARNSGWETHKENIQPLCRGRKVSILQHSLDTSRNVVDYEQEMEQQIRNYEEKIAAYKGDDPMEPWTEFITFLEQSNLMVAKLKKKLTETVKACIKQFSGSPKYTNDKRFVDLYLKVSKDLQANQRCALLKQFQEKGVGNTVAEMYLIISDLEESEGKFEEALKTLQRGVLKQAQPIEKIQDALEGIQFRTAQRLAETYKKGPQDCQNDVNERAFGASVPVFGPKCDAPVFRNDLEPALPVPRFKQQMHRGGTESNNKPNKPIQIYPTLENETGSKTQDEEVIIFENQSSVIRSSLADISCKTPVDKENRLDPSTWNRPEIVIPKEDFVVPASTEAPVEKFKLFRDEEPVQQEEQSNSVKHVDFRSGNENAHTTGQKHVTISTVYNGSCNGSTNSIQIVALKMCQEFGQIEQRKRKLWREKDALRLKSLNTQKLSHELDQLKIRFNKIEVELIESTSRLNEAVHCNSTLQEQLVLKEKELNYVKKSADTELQKLRSTKDELTLELESQDSKIRELHVIISNERYRAEQLSNDLEDQKKLNEELNTRLEAEQKKAAADNCSGPSSSSTSTLVATTGSVSNASNSGGNGITGEGVSNNSNINQLSNDEFSFLPKAPPLSHHVTDRAHKPRRSVAFSSGETFNASVRMGTTHFMKEDTCAAVPLLNYGNGIPQKLPLKPVEIFDDSSFLPPPPLPKKGLTFNLYESCADSHSASLFAPMTIAPTAFSKPMGPPATLQNTYAKENIPPTFVVPVASRQYELEGRSSMAIGSTVDVEISAIDMDDSDVFHAGKDRANNFDLADLTRNLQLNQPLLNSTPEKFATANCAMNINEQRGNFIHTQRFKAITFAPDELEVEGPMSPEVLARSSRRTMREEAQSDENAIGNVSRLPLNLSPIQETSKENRSSTTGSSSGNMTSTRGGSTVSGASLYNSRSVSATKSASRNYPYNFNN